MANTREIRLRIRSVKNISQVTRALQAVSASRVRKAMEAVERTRPYATKAWQVLTHIAGQPGRGTLHPLLTERQDVKSVLVVMVSGDRGLAGAYNTNILRFTLSHFRDYPVPVRYVAVGRKGAELLFRRGLNVMAQFTDLPAEPQFTDASPIGRILVQEFLAGRADQIVPRFTALQVYQALLESIASEHAARMVAMKNATENASDLASALTLQYNKVRQQSITNEMLDIAGGAEAQAQAR